MRDYWKELLYVLKLSVSVVGFLDEGLLANQEHLQE
ncbi:Uncharacterised protein [Legionella pneumophila]|nr:Uncharacterised protein [Legionella pneumophila]